MRLRKRKTYEALVTWLGSHPEPSFSIREPNFSGSMRVLNFSRGHVLKVPADLALAIEALGAAGSWRIRMSPQARRWAWRLIFRRGRPAKRLNKKHRDHVGPYLTNRYAIGAGTIIGLGTKNYSVAIDENWTLRWDP